MYPIILRGYDIVYHSLRCSRRRNHHPPLTESLGKRGENYLSKKMADLTSNSSKMATLKTKQCLNLVTRFINSRTPPFHYKNTRTLQTLAFEEIQSSPNKPDAPTAIILHGLLGSGRNWRSFSRNLASSLSGTLSLSYFLCSFSIFWILDFDLVIYYRVEDGACGYEEPWQIC